MTSAPNDLEHYEVKVPHLITDSTSAPNDPNWPWSLRGQGTQFSKFGKILE